MSGVQIPTSSSQLDYAKLGYNGISLTNWATSAASVIEAGSNIEVASAFFHFSSDDTNDATSFSVIATGATAYLQLEPAGTVPSQIVTSSWTDVAPTWRGDAAGWYASAGSNVRYVAGCVKTGTTSYENKFIITPRGNLRHEQAESFANLTATTFTVTGTATVASLVSTGSITTGSAIITGTASVAGTATLGGLTVTGTTTLSGTVGVAGILTASSGISENSVVIKRKIMNIGDWDMNTTTTLTVAHGLTSANIRTVEAFVRDDSDGGCIPLDIFLIGTSVNTEGSVRRTGSNIELKRNPGGLFDSVSFDSTSFNRGWISIEYEA